MSARRESSSHSGWHTAVLRTFQDCRTTCRRCRRSHTHRSWKDRSRSPRIDRRSIGGQGCTREAPAHRRAAGAPRACSRPGRCCCSSCSPCRHLELLLDELPASPELLPEARSGAARAAAAAYSSSCCCRSLPNCWTPPELPLPALVTSDDASASPAVAFASVSAAPPHRTLRAVRAVSPHHREQARTH